MKGIKVIDGGCNPEEEVEDLKSDVGKHVLVGLIDEYNIQKEETDE